MLHLVRVPETRLERDFRRSTLIAVKPQRRDAALPVDRAVQQP